MFKKIISSIFVMELKQIAVVLVFIGVSTAVPPYGATGHGGYGYDDHYVIINF